MEELFKYLSQRTGQKWVTILYKDHHGKTIRVSKTDGSDTQFIRQSIENLQAKGINNIIAEVQRANGKTTRREMQFTIGNGHAIENGHHAIGNGHTIKNGHDAIENGHAIAEGQTFGIQPTTEKTATKNTMNWEWAYNQEVAKVKHLLHKTEALENRNQTLADQIIEFKLTMKDKDHALEQAIKDAEAKIAKAGSLGNVVEKASANPETMKMVNMVLGKFLGMVPDQPQQNQIAGATAQAQQYIDNISAWLVKQEVPLQEKFYAMVFELTKRGSSLDSNLDSIINFITNGTDL